jgi:single-strand DNA-binding protein
MFLNKVFLFGNLTRDPELKALPSGVNVCNFSIATNRTFKDRDGKKQEQTEFHNVVAFGRTADIIAQYLKKGSSVLVEGRIQTRSWEKDGAKQYRTEIIVENMQLGPRPVGAGGGAPRAAASAPDTDDVASAGAGIAYPKEEINPEDIPF